MACLIECFCEYVCQLLTVSNEWCHNFSRLHIFSNKVTINFNMFRTFMKNRVENNMPCCLIVTIHFHGFLVFYSKVMKKVFDPFSSLAVDSMVRYSAFALDLATIFYFLLFYVTRLPPTKTQKPMVDFLSWLSAQSASEKSTISLVPFFFIRIP
jgi:hypothetical protein